MQVNGFSISSRFGDFRRLDGKDSIDNIRGEFLSEFGVELRSKGGVGNRNEVGTVEFRGLLESVKELDSRTLADSHTDYRPHSRSTLPS